MTTREFLNSVLNAHINPEVDDAAKALLEKLDARNAKRASTPSKTQLANEPIKSAIVTLIGAKSMTASDIGANLDISTQKASALCRQLVESGALEVGEVKIPKKGTVKIYSVVTK